MTDDPELHAKGQAIFYQMAAEQLAASPLAMMSEWVKAGRAPPAAALRSAGFVAEGSRQNTWVIRKAFVAQWGFSIPCAEVLGALYRLGPLVELGAGSGYWTAIMRAAGADMIATDKTSEGSPGYGLTVGLHSEVEPLEGLSAVRAHPTRNVFCSWPTEGDDWCAEAVSAINPGRYLALIGKDRGGNTGSEALFDVLDREFEFKGRLTIPQFPESPDTFTLYQRRA